MNGPKATSALSPFDSQLRTLVGEAHRSHSCQNQTHAPRHTEGGQAVVAGDTVTRGQGERRRGIIEK
jgi:hypothetical protein